MEIPGFEILDKLGTGGMATVWKARQVSLDRVVAIKILSRQFAADPADIQNFQTEAQSAAKLKHPGIVQVYDANALHGTYYIVMEYVDGMTVGDLVRRKGKFSEKEALRIGISVAEALEYAWKKAGIIHCDIKADNIMLDADDTVKVSDLGLARTIRAMTSRADSEEIMGTPSFMSPEQIRGERVLDCRTDIYALGATLYYAVTGQELFGGHPYNDVLRMQLLDTVTDPVDVNPKLSKMMSAMIETMLAKDRQHRQHDWEEVVSDLTRVRKNHPPRRHLQAGEPSTIRRSAKRLPPPSSSRMVAPAEGQIQSRTQMETPEEKRQTRLALLATLVILASIVVLIKPAKDLIRNKQRQAEQRQAVIAQRESAQRVAKEALEHVQWFIRANPDKFDEAVARLEAIAARFPESEQASLAKGEIQRLGDAKKRRIREIMDKLGDQAEKLGRKDAFLAAAKVYEGYGGPFAAATAEDRQAKAKVWSDKHEQQEQERKDSEKLAEQKWKEVLDDVASRLVMRGTGSALMKAEEASNDETLAVRKPEIEKIAQLLHDAGNIDSRVVASFKAQAGKAVTLILEGKKQMLTVIEAKDGRIVCEEVTHTPLGKDSRAVRFSVADLTLQERLARMGADSDPGVALAKGLIMLDMGACPRAKEYFAMVESVLTERLVAFVENQSTKLSDVQAEKDLIKILNGAGVSVGFFDPAAWGKSVKEKTVTREVFDAIAQNLKAYRARYAKTVFMQKAEPVVAALEGIRVLEEDKRPRPAPKPDSGDATLPADVAQVKDALLESMVARNQGLFPEDIKLTVDKDNQLRARIISPALRDISPLSVLKKLQSLTCAAVDPDKGQGKEAAPLSDISALAGLSLETLCLAQTSVADLAPLRGMKLKELDLHMTPVADLGALAGMPLATLDLRHTKVQDLGPLKGMPLKTLNISGTAVDDLSGVVGMPLDKLEFGGTRVKDIECLRGTSARIVNMADTRVSDISALAGSGLVYLNANNTRIERIDALKGLALTHLYLDNTKVRDISPLSGGKLAVLSLNGAPVKDLAPLAGLPLRILNISGTRVQDLSGLAGMGLDQLSLAETKVSDLSPLKNSKIRYLDIKGSKVDSLKAITRLPLVYLDCRDVDADDFRPLAQMPIQTLWINNPEGPVKGVLSSMPNLKEVNGAVGMR